MRVWQAWRDEVVTVRIRMGSDRAKKAIHIDLARLPSSSRHGFEPRSSLFLNEEILYTLCRELNGKSSSWNRWIKQY